MADFQLLGHITNISFRQDCILIFVDEYKKGYKRQDGTKVDDKIISWRCIFSGNEKKHNYISKYFSRGMLVQVKGEIMPYAIEQNKTVEGYTVFVQTINIAAYPRKSIKEEQKMIKESQQYSSETPNLDEFNKPDF